MNLNGTVMISKTKKLSSANTEFSLTLLELTCLKLTANGLKPIEISNSLQTQETEINETLVSAERKLGARNRLHAIGIAVSQGLIGIDGK
jgi:DNA-binding CsgD family transcriptional regulator